MGSGIIRSVDPFAPIRGDARGQDRPFGFLDFDGRSAWRIESLVVSKVRNLGSSDQRKLEYRITMASSGKARLNGGDLNVER